MKKSVFGLMLALAITGCGNNPVDVGIDVVNDTAVSEDDSITPPDIVDVTADSHEGYLDADAAEANDSDVFDVPAEVFTCQSEDLDWVTLRADIYAFQEYGFWVLERSSHILIRGGKDVIETSNEVPEERFIEIDCIVSSASFQEGMISGFGCSGAIVSDVSMGLTLELRNGQLIQRGVNDCVFATAEDNDAKSVVSKINSAFMTIPVEY